MNDIDCDVAVFGSGLAGLTAAVVAASMGMRTVLFEKAAALGGTTATSGGVVWIPGNSQAKAAGVNDSMTDVRRYLEQQLGDSIRPELIDAFLDSGAEAIDYLAAHSDMRFELASSPDYQTDVPGSAVKGRALSPLPFDGRLLGDNFRLVRAPREAFMILGGLMVGRHEIPKFLRPFSSWSNFRHVSGLVRRHLSDRLRHPRGTRLLIGNALVARGVHSALKLGVRIVPDAALIRLRLEEGRVTGATVAHADGNFTVRANRAVVLATGGLAHNRRLRETHMPRHPHRHTLASEGNTGDAALAALQVGAVIDDQLESPAFWTPASVARDAAGRETVFPYGHLDRGKPGAIIVNRAGKRFVNESDSYHHVVLAMFAAKAVAPDDQAFLICDHDFIRRYGLGLVKPHPFPHGPHLRNGYLSTGRTLRDLAAKLGVDAEALENTVARHNEFARTGKDLDFKKGDSAYNRFNGDARGQPNPCLLPIAAAPYYAIEIVPGTLGTAVGIRTDADARVVDGNDVAIPGLYACGNDMASVFRGAYPGPGITLGPGLVFAYRAMKHAALAVTAETQAPSSTQEHR